MTEQQIEDGFRQLAGALTPPADTIARVERRVRSRRRRRRAVVVGGATLALVAVAGSAVALSSGDNGEDLVATDPPTEPSTLTMVRPDGSTHAFPDVTVSCESPYEEPTKVQRIYASSPREIERGKAVTPFVYFEGIVAELEGDRTFTFPNEWNMASDELPLVLFAADTDGNEVASSAGGESGTVRVLEAACDPAPVLRLEVDMTLGSEVGMRPLDITGDLTSP